MKTLKKELKTRFDTTNIIVNGNFSFSKKIYLKNKKIYTK